MLLCIYILFVSCLFVPKFFGFFEFIFVSAVL